MNPDERARLRGRRRPRPERIEPAGPGRVSVWEFPRPPRIESVRRRVRVEFAGEVLAESDRALRVCETSSPPTYYLPFADVRCDWLEPTRHRTGCEWKGGAVYWSVRTLDRCSERAAWSYPEPDSGFAALRDHVAFHAGRVDACFVGDVRVTPQAGGYYGGWITPELTGPFKGAPGSEHW